RRGRRRAAPRHRRPAPLVLVLLLRPQPRLPRPPAPARLARDPVRPRLRRAVAAAGAPRRPARAARDGARLPRRPARGLRPARAAACEHAVAHDTRRAPAAVVTRHLTGAHLRLPMGPGCVAGRNLAGRTPNLPES